MAKEVARTTTTRGTVEPYHGGSDGDELLPHAPMVAQSFEVPDYVALRPPETGGIQDHWSKIMTPFRFVALSFLWITLYWWRTTLLVVVILMIVTLFRVS